MKLFELFLFPFLGCRVDFVVRGKLGITLANLAPAIVNRGAHAFSLDKYEDLSES